MPAADRADNPRKLGDTTPFIAHSIPIFGMALCIVALVGGEMGEERRNAEQISPSRLFCDRIICKGVIGNPGRSRFAITNTIDSDKRTGFGQLRIGIAFCIDRRRNFGK